MIQGSVARCDFSGRYAPGLGGGFFQHLTRGGAGNPQAVHAGGTDTETATGNLQVHGVGNVKKSAIHAAYQESRNLGIPKRIALAQRPVRVSILCRCFDKGNLIPAHIEFVGQHLG